MRKIVFIVLATKILEEKKGLNFISCPELDELFADGWNLTNTHVITPPSAQSRAILQVNLNKQ